MTISSTSSFSQTPGQLAPLASHQPSSLPVLRLTSSPATYEFRSSPRPAFPDLKSDQLLEPRVYRRERLASWFRSCWCSRCASGVDDARCFLCPEAATSGCAGTCQALLDVGGGEESEDADRLSVCAVCGAAHDESSLVSALRAEEQLTGALDEWEQEAESGVADGSERDALRRTRAVLQLANAALGPTHWLRASLSWMADTRLVAAGESLEAAACLQTYGDVWHGSFGFPVLRTAWRFERAGDLLSSAGETLGAARAYLRAREQLAALALPQGVSGYRGTAGVDGKLRAVLDGPIAVG